MGWVSSVFKFLMAVPDLIGIIKQIWAAIEAGKDFIELRINLGKFDKAVGKAKKEKDTSELEDLFNPKPKP